MPGILKPTEINRKMCASSELKIHLTAISQRTARYPAIERLVYAAVNMTQSFAIISWSLDVPENVVNLLHPCIKAAIKLSYT
jgi:hypothetical protein